MLIGRRKQREIPEQKPDSTDDAKPVEFAIETISPEIAQDYLDTSPERAELLDSKPFAMAQPEIASDLKTVSAYSEMMKSGGWVLNGMPIIFDPAGRLIDGIARLEACLLSGFSFRTAVARNVRADTLHTIDQHRRRTYTGVLESRGIRHAGALQRTMTKLIRIENGLLGIDQTKISWPRFDRVLEGNPELQEAVSVSEGSKGSLLHSTPRPVLCFMALKAEKRDKLRFFLAGLRDIESFPLGNPARMLANQLKGELRRGRSARESGREYSGMFIDNVLAISVKAFNDFCAEKTVEEEYYWEPNFGRAKKDRSDRRLIRELAPPNLGLPLVDGYTGLRNGAYDVDVPADAFSGELAETLKQAAQEVGDVTIEMRTITPNLAREYLRLNRDNRALSDEHKRMIAKDILAGNWMLNAQPISFTGDPDAADLGEVRLLNGQHRLHACIEADAPIEVPIAKNIPPAAFATFDAHTRKIRLRSGTDADDRVLAAAARLQWKEDNNLEMFSKGVSPTATEIRETIKRHPNLAEYYPQSRAMKQVGSSGVITYLIYHVRRDRPDLADDFLDGLKTGENLRAKDPILAARTKIVGQRAADRPVRPKIPRLDVLKTLILCWRDYKAFRDAEN